MRFGRWVIMSRAVWLVAAADLIGALLGFVYWYGDDILQGPWYYWVFIPDCPLAAMLMGIALLGFHFKRGWHLLGLLAVGTCVKYGLWTVVYWAANYSAGGSYDLESITMSLTHFAMLVQGLLLTRFLRYRLWPVLVAVLFLAGNDVVDYVAGYHPRLPALVQVGLMMRVAVVMTVVIAVFWGVMTWVSARRERG